MTLVAASMTAPVPGNVTVVPAGSALELRERMLELKQDADVIIMTAAVADFRPAHYADAKIKKADGSDELTISLVKNPDILKELTSARRESGQIIVGFAAETGDSQGDVLYHGRNKALRKGADLLVVNEVGEAKGFGTADNSVVILDSEGEPLGETSGTKLVVAHAILDQVARIAAR